MNGKFQRTARRDKKAFLNDQCKEQRKSIEWERLEISSRKLEIFREYFMQRWAHKGQKRNGPNKQKRLRRGGKNTQNNIEKKFLMTQITMIV